MDGCGNSATATESFNVTDNTPPVITGVGAGGNIVCPAVPVFSTPTATDACGTATITFTDATTLAPAPRLSITRTFTAADGCGNSATATEAFTVTDNTPPVITGVGAGGNIVCPAVPVFSTPTATDACGTATITFTDATTSGSAPTLIRSPEHLLLWMAAVTAPLQQKHLL